MAAEKGNQYWLLAKAALGRKRIFKTAEEFDEKFLEYIKWTEENPILNKSATKRECDLSDDEDPDRKRNELRMHTVSKRRPLSTYGLCAFLGVSSKWFTMTIKNLENKEDKKEDELELFTSLTRALTLIQMQQFDGGCVGDFNPSIITRALNLNDSVDITSNGEELKAPSLPVINIIKDHRKAEGEE